MSNTLEIVAVLGLLIVGGFWWWQASFTRLAFDGVETSAIVDSVPDRIERTDSPDYFRAWVAYEDQAGVEHRQYLRVPTGAVLGSEMFLIHDPHNPETADWRGRGDHLGAAVFLPGLVLVGFAGVALYERRNRRAANF